MKIRLIDSCIATRLLSGLIILSLWTACGDPAVKDERAESTSKDYQSEDSVRAAFDRYKAAILNDRGEEAIQYVDSRTMAYYSKISELAKTADSLELESLALIDKFMVLTVRYKASREDILAFDGKSLLIYAINSGMVGKNSVANNSVGKVTIVDEFAEGEFMSNGQETPFSFNFYYEEKRWKVDITSIFAASQTAFEQMIAQSGQSENEFIVTALESVGDKKISTEIWRPVQE